MLLVCGYAYSQPQELTHLQQVPDITGIVAKTETSPSDDSVLNDAPDKIGLEFPRQVRLVKLTLHNAQRDWVDIGFRYDPLANDIFSWELPTLDTAVYYTADWAILASNEMLIRGSFSFSFGSEAKAPSVTKQAEQDILDLRIGGSGELFVTPPRTEIIINQDPPQYDPPFIIELQQELQNNPN
ncbi:MAG: hypothetical protein COA96_08745 [SAR86 cluster bacterium]|uniref:CopC domain-containing protein n=1 Tax=SAR86 cluster bacterium TaxID=2030880 RepID=A0A2A5B0Y4_9GAMM|nr:MAG: hypothetical protein COA96_08745 [SAR86 cluster bacterium]